MYQREEPPLRSYFEDAIIWTSEGSAGTISKVFERKQEKA
jgi:hypothetical protein